MSYADMALAMVPAAPPTRKNQRATSWPAPISAKVPYFTGSRLTWSALKCVSGVSWDIQISNRLYGGRVEGPRVLGCHGANGANGAKGARVLEVLQVRGVLWCAR